MRKHNRTIMPKSQQPRVAFAQRSEFSNVLRQRVDSYFRSKNIKPNDNLAMYFKSAIIYGWVLASWAFTLWGPSNVWFKVLGCIALGLGLAGFGMSVGHDANHGSYSKSPMVNRFLVISMTVLGYQVISGDFVIINYTTSIPISKDSMSRFTVMVTSECPQANAISGTIDFSIISSGFYILSCPSTGFRRMCGDSSFLEIF